MTTADRPTPPASRLGSWLVGCVLVGWLVVYNLMRVAGSTPSDAALPALLAGGAAGVVAFGVGVTAARRMRPHDGAAASAVRTPAEMDDGQRAAVAMAWPPLAAMAVVALGLGAYLAVDWITTDGTRAKTTAVLAGWNILVGLWLGDEALRLRRGELDGIESIVLGCVLTAALAGVALSRELAAPTQVALIVLSGIAGALVGVAVWRLRGARGIPAGAIGVVVVAALALVLPLID